MSKRRKITTKDSDKELRNKKGPNGFRLCRWCKKEVQPPKRTFCSDPCVHEWKLRSNTGYLRKHTYKRDLGVCAMCKSDTRLQRIQIENTLKECEYDEKSSRYTELLATLNITVNEARNSIWDADHEVPVANGGGLCGLSNIRTLCKKCHKGKTAVQATYRTKSRGLKGMKQLGGVGGLDGITGIKRIKGI